MDADQQEVKRLKFSKEEEDEDDEEEEEEEQEVETMRPSHIACVSKEAEAMVHEEEEVEYSKENEASTSALASEDQGEARLLSPCWAPLVYFLSVVGLMRPTSC